jgi:CubicO group peptidase (beta-lactamase class C family)
MRSIWTWLGVAVLLAVTLVVFIFFWRIEPAVRVGTAVISQTLCGETFVAGLDPLRVFQEEITPRPALGPLLRHAQFFIDTQRREVRTTWFGHFDAVAAFHPGYGCSVGETRFPSAPPEVTASDPPAELPVVEPNPKLEAALDHAFAEPGQPQYRQVRAIVIMHDGQVVAERYAPGVSVNTPLLGYSVSKSVVNALVGILVREGKLDPEAPAPVAAWSSPSDPRRAITLDQLMRMTSGLDLAEEDTGFDPVSRMMFLESDMAAFAQRASLKAAPGTTWKYTSGNTLIVASIIRDRVGGHAEDVLRFAHQELFDPVGMAHVTMEFDGAGTPVGSTRMYASARDWARFGNLYLNDGVVNSRRILPENWVSYSTRPTLDSDYGAGFWVNAGAADDARGRVKSGMPADSYFASGNFGQRIVIIPSRGLVIVRFGATINVPGMDIHGLTRLVAEVLAAQNP